MNSEFDPQTTNSVSYDGEATTRNQFKRPKSKNNSTGSPTTQQTQTDQKRLTRQQTRDLLNTLERKQKEDDTASVLDGSVEMGDSPSPSI